jgi:hypothetical protein
MLGLKIIQRLIDISKYLINISVEVIGRLKEVL